LKLCRLAESILDVADSLGNKKVGVQTDVQYNTIKSHQPALQTIEAFQAQIEAQKLASSTFKSKYSNECIGKNKEPFEISFTVDRFRAIYERFSKAPPPKPRPTTRGAGGTQTAGGVILNSATKTAGTSANTPCLTPAIDREAEKTWKQLTDNKQFPMLQSSGLISGTSCDFHFELKRVGPGSFSVRDLKSEIDPKSFFPVKDIQALADVLKRPRYRIPSANPTPPPNGPSITPTPTPQRR